MTCDAITAVSFFKFDPQTGLYLGVSRKDDPNAFGLPGGKVDPGEDVEDSVVRELREETGFIADPTTLKCVYEGWCGPGKDGKDYYVATYTGDTTGEIHTEEAGRVAWVTAQQLLEGPFGDYNRRLLQTVGHHRCQSEAASQRAEAKGQVLISATLPQVQETPQMVVPGQRMA